MQGLSQLVAGILSAMMFSTSLPVVSCIFTVIKSTKATSLVTFHEHLTSNQIIIMMILVLRQHQLGIGEGDIQIRERSHSPC